MNKRNLIKKVQGLLDDLKKTQDLVFSVESMVDFARNKSAIENKINLQNDTACNNINVEKDIIINDESDESLEDLLGLNDVLIENQEINKKESEPQEVSGVDKDGWPLFLEEFELLNPDISRDIRNIKDKNANIETVFALQRNLHTIKGASRMVGALDIGGLVHDMESIMNESVENNDIILESKINIIEECWDKVCFWVEDLNAKINVQGVESEVIDKEALLVFLEEAEELIPKIEAGLRLLRSNNDAENIQSLERNLHTIKGSAKMVGAKSLGDLVHEMESVAESLKTGEVEVSSVIDLLDDHFDDVVEKIDLLMHPEHSTQDQKNKNQEFGAVVSKNVRINTEIIDHLVNAASEVRLASATLTGGMESLSKTLDEMVENSKRLTKMIRELESQTETQMMARKASQEEEGLDFDPLEFDRFNRSQELTRFIAETVHDIMDLEGFLEKIIKEQEAMLLHQDQVSSNIQQTLMNIRLVKLQSIEERLSKTTRIAAKELGKQVRLVVEGKDVEVDRGVLDRMVAPLEHLLRNAVAHGIEMPEERIKGNKKEEGLISLIARHEGNTVYLSLKDDGKGLNLDGVRKKAVEKNLIKEGAVLSEQNLIDLIFMPGFSTADSVSQIAGRGVGMDVVRNEIVSLGGQIDVKTYTGKGMVFEITLPVSLATTQAVLIEEDGELWTIPTEIIEEIKSLNTAEMEAAIRSREVVHEGVARPFEIFSELVGDARKLEVRKNNSVLFLRSGEKMLAIWVDRLLGTKEIVVKNIGRQLTRISGLMGATVMGDGSLALIVNPIFLLNQKIINNLESIVSGSLNSNVPIASLPTVMVVDDSLTIRKATNKLLERAGYAVILAKDGVDALEKLKEEIPHIILSDVEMPRMDGFELLKALKNDERYSKIPIVMITSRTAEKHKTTGLNLGANAYLGKPYKEDELLIQIESLINMQ